MPDGVRDLKICEQSNVALGVSVKRIETERKPSSTLASGMIGAVSRWACQKLSSHCCHMPGRGRMPQVS